ncbi:hypothetical protein [Marinicellulosiphila megalodicopiae]|uniref:hypothetical protein n=1 Tax=Marinicellulosiphila megalodicopiae TaxID=2724896 RepID=UPI003BB11A1A
MRKLIIILSTLIFTTIASAGELPFGSGSVTGNYYAMMNDIISEDWCAPESGDDVLVNTASGGSIDNIDGMMNKRFYGGIVQVDVLKYYAKTTPNKVNQNSIGIISGLHTESFHLIFPNNWKPEGEEEKSGGWFSSKSDEEETVALKLETLIGQTVGSWGGSLVSLKALSSFYNLNLNIVEIPEGQRASPTIPFLLVGGQPYAAVENILKTNRYTLVSINYLELAEKAPFYVKSNLTYNIGGKLVVIPSVGVQALLVAKKFRKESKNQLSIDLATCLDESIYDLADDFDTNPNWESAAEMYESNDSINWTYFKLND